MSKVEKIKRMIERERNKRGLSQRELCKLAGMSSATYNALMTRNNGPTLATLIAFCDAMHMEVEIRCR